MPGALRSLGADPSEVLSELGLELSLFDSPDNRISYLDRGRLIEHCATRTNCPHFGLLVGQRAGLAAFGFVGLLTRYSPDVGSALRSLARFMHLHVRGATVILEEDSDLAVLEYQIYESRAAGNEQVGDGATAVAFNIVRELCGDDWQPLEVRFAHRKPQNPEPFRRFFRVPLRFDAAQYAVVFSSVWLKHRLPETSPELRLLLQQEIEKLEIQQQDSFLEQVRSLLRTTLVTGHSSADQVAGLLAMHRRTLNRHLRAFGTSYQEVVHELRFELARQLLENSQMEIIQIASVLGYSNASSFTRAFRRWSSTTPARWRTAAINNSRTERPRRPARRGLSQEDS